MQDPRWQPALLRSPSLCGPHVFIDVSGANEVHDSGVGVLSEKQGESWSSSMCNHMEAWVVTCLIKTLVAGSSRRGRGALSIGCITTYDVQVGHPKHRVSAMPIFKQYGGKDVERKGFTELRGHVVWTSPD
jgi:hypothetical protein